MFSESSFLISLSISELATSLNSFTNDTTMVAFFKIDYPIIPDSQGIIKASSKIILSYNVIHKDCIV